MVWKSVLGALVFIFLLASSAQPLSLYASNFGGGVLRYDGETGAYVDAFVPHGSGGLLSPRGTTCGPVGNLYAVDNVAATVSRYDGSTGAFIDTSCSGDGLTVEGIIQD